MAGPLRKRGAFFWPADTRNDYQELVQTALVAQEPASANIFSIFAVVVAQEIALAS